MATIAGAGTGAYAGNEIAKNQNAKTTYRVVVTMEDGTTRNFNYTNRTSFKVGDRVKVVQNKLARQ